MEVIGRGCGRAARCCCCKGTEERALQKAAAGCKALRFGERILRTLCIRRACKAERGML